MHSDDTPLPRSRARLPANHPLCARGAAAVPLALLLALGLAAPLAAASPSASSARTSRGMSTADCQHVDRQKGRPQQGERQQGERQDPEKRGSDGEPSAKQQGTEAQDAADQMAAWPKLDPTQIERVMQLFANLRKEDDELRARSRQELEALGDGALPLMVARLSDQEPNINAELIPLLDQRLRTQHTSLIAREAADRKVAVRRYVLGWLAQHPTADLQPVFRKATKDKDREVAFRAALGLAATGDLAALEPVLERCVRDWRDVGEMVSAALAAARGRDPGEWVLKQMAKGEVPAKIAGLRLLRSLGTRDQAMAIKSYLDSPDHAIKKEAINALRAIVDGEPPLENLSVFEAIETAKEWKKKT